MRVRPTVVPPFSAGKEEKTNTGSTAAGGSLFREALQKVNQQQLNAAKAVQELAAGELEDLHQVMIATEQARLSLQLAVQVTNKAVEAYKEITRMQI
ncbi:MAG: flagellar hook-basal body complex protein FliE [Firmicutes bacterium]|nr:flagellar hook-basal body complex protein FliE [Bacillota bacterium]